MITPEMMTTRFLWFMGGIVSASGTQAFKR